MFISETYTHQKKKQQKTNKQKLMLPLLYTGHQFELVADLWSVYRV